MPAEQVRNSLTVVGVVIMISSPFFAEPAIFTLRDLLIRTGVTSDSSYGFCGAALALTCSVYAIFGTLLFGLALVLISSAWWYTEVRQAKMVNR